MTEAAEAFGFSRQIAAITGSPRLTPTDPWKILWASSNGASSAPGALSMRTDLIRQVAAWLLVVNEERPSREPYVHLQSRS